MSPLTLPPDDDARPSLDSLCSTSTTSLVFDRLLAHSENLGQTAAAAAADDDNGSSDLPDHDSVKEAPLSDLETGSFLHPSVLSALSRQRKRTAGWSCRWIAISLAVALVIVWIVAVLVLTAAKAARLAAQTAHDPGATHRPSGKLITLDQLQSSFWSPSFKEVSWIAGPKDQDGLLLSTGVQGKDHLVMEDVRTIAAANTPAPRHLTIRPAVTLVRDPVLVYQNESLTPDAMWPSPDVTKVLLITDRQRLWRHSSTGRFWILDVASQTLQPLLPDEPTARVQLATWSPQSNAVVYTRDNDMFLRTVAADPAAAASVTPITRDGSADYFYGVPDWVYEEEVLSGPRATWWSPDGRYLAFLRTNESTVPEFTVDYFLSRPSGKKPLPGLDAYPDSRRLKYPKAGAPNPVVDVQFYDVQTGERFTVDFLGQFDDDDRIINAVLWTGDTRLLVKQTNRVSDILRVILVDVATRQAAVVRTVDVSGQDGGWCEVSKAAVHVPADPSMRRSADGYIDTVIQDGRNHLAYFSTLDSPTPTVLLTSGPWDVDGGPSAVDLSRNLVYFVATRESSIQRHVYSVSLDGSNLQPVTNITVEGYYSVSFSTGAGFALLTYTGPGVPWQRIITPPVVIAHMLDTLLEDNSQLAARVATHQLPELVYGTLDVDGLALNYVERRPAHFDPTRRYPVLFQQYSGPGSQSVTKRFAVDFQTYVAATLGYITVTLDGRGTGFIGRAARVAVRGRLGQLEALDQRAAARHWAALPYVDPARLAIWGWSYGGFTALKTLELDAGATFSYGIAVAPVTDWRFYDSIYTERYMRTPAQNPAGYAAAAVANASALGASVRLLLVHGAADDNVHLQNTLALLDALDLAGVENYDVHVFPDSNHGIYFHNANKIVYDKLSNWLINAFNGEWLRVKDAEPKSERVW